MFKDNHLAQSVLTINDGVKEAVRATGPPLACTNYVEFENCTLLSTTPLPEEMVPTHMDVCTLGDTQHLAVGPCDPAIRHCDGLEMTPEHFNTAVALIALEND